MRNGHFISMPPREKNSVNSLGERANLIQFNKNRIRHMLVYTVLYAFNIRDKNVLPNEHNPFPEGFGRFNPIFPIILGKDVFNGENWILFYPFPKNPKQFIRAATLFLAFKVIFSASIKFRRRDIKRKIDLFPRDKSGLLDCLENEFDCLFII